MAIYSIDDKRQEPIGQKEQWKLFVKFQGSPLHSFFVSTLKSNLNLEFIDSSVLGKRIIEDAIAQSADLLDGYSNEQIGGLFGMTLWNELAKSPRAWYFISKSSDPNDLYTGTEYFPKNNK